MPWTVFISAGLMGAARARSRTDLEEREGEMECVCSLGVVSRSNCPSLASSGRCSL